MTSRQTLQRFFAPVKYSPKAFATTAFLRIYQAILIVASTNMLKLITNYITAGDGASIYTFVYIYGVAILGYFIILYIWQDDESHSYIYANHHIFRDNLAKVLTMTKGGHYKRMLDLQSGF